jgi:hypothetical protein
MAMGRFVTLTLSAQAHRAAVESRQLTEVNAYLREAERIMDKEIERAVLDMMTFGVGEWPKSA